MAVTQHTIRAYQGELIRCAITVGTASGDENQFWLDARQDPPVVGSFTGDITVETTDPDTRYTRWRWNNSGNGVLLINRSGGIFMSLQFVAGGAMDGKHLYITTIDTSDVPEVDINLLTSLSGTPGGGFVNIAPSTAHAAILNAIRADDVINLVIADATVAAGVSDISATFALGAPAFSAALGKTTVSDQDRAVAFALGAPSFSVALGIEDATTQDRAVGFQLGAPAFSVSVEKAAVGTHNLAPDFALGIPSFSVVLSKLVPADRTGPLATQLSQGIAQMKSTLLQGGLLRSVQWLQRTGDKDERGRQAVTTKLLDALIERRPGLDRNEARVTEQQDQTLLIILDPISVSTDDLFRWGGHSYKVSKIDGVVKNEATGVRFSSEVVVIR